jgi:hypothetical protein
MGDPTVPLYPLRAKRTGQWGGGPERSSGEPASRGRGGRNFSPHRLSSRVLLCIQKFTIGWSMFSSSLGSVQCEHLDTLSFRKKPRQFASRWSLPVLSPGPFPPIGRENALQVAWVSAFRTTSDAGGAHHYQSTSSTVTREGRGTGGFGSGRRATRP